MWGPLGPGLLPHRVTSTELTALVPADGAALCPGHETNGIWGQYRPGPQPKMICSPRFPLYFPALGLSALPDQSCPRTPPPNPRVLSCRETHHCFKDWLRPASPRSLLRALAHGRAPHSPGLTSPFPQLPSNFLPVTLWAHSLLHSFTHPVRTNHLVLG